ncbi:16S rRNA (uracil(1498)-N(3))-methyltransferase [Ramlibacter albus]|uniref:Ribosomal RNA small subunit methyltransferase E n=1 Tax=Ramlibacter albus TaxID=2079448 RepID=A0A923M3X5_9BURK|nr:16S rRNA (uracil(1498)-N(3))-methyltransferase [Ramlibacter albus]
MPRIFCETALQSGASLGLPPAAARHVQVLRMQPGDALTLFDGRGGEYTATVERMGRSDVQVLVGDHDAVEREAAREVHLALGMPANERMDWLVEKATELGAASIQPLLMQHSVLRLAGERALKKQAHWQSIAIAACEQCGRNRVPQIHAVATLDAWLSSPNAAESKFVLSPAAASTLDARTGAGSVCVLSGPEGGLAPAEEEAAVAKSFLRAGLGPRILRAETAPLAALALTTLAR